MHQSFVIGIDMGGTNVSLGVVDARGNILYSTSVRISEITSEETYIEAISKAVNNLIAQSGLGEYIKGIGIGAPMGNSEKGTIEMAANIPWARNKEIPLAQILKDKTGFPVKLANDANAAAIGEMTYGAARGMKNFIVITLGTGIGSGIVVNGQLLLGCDGYAGELGHVRVVKQNGRRCGCGREGCLETYASATGMAKTAREFLEIFPDKKSLLRNISHREITSKDVYEAAGEGDELAIEIFNYTGKVLGEAFADFVAFSSPEAIILFGGLASAGDYLLKPLQEEFDKKILSIFRGHTKIIFSALNDAEAAILGAGALAWETN
jgi:glucokinase